MNTVYKTSWFCKIFYAIIVIPCNLLVILNIEKKFGYLETIVGFALIITSLFYTFGDTFGRKIIINENTVIQKSFFIFQKKMKKDSIQRCFLKLGVNTVERRGYYSLRLESEKSFMNINCFYFNKKVINEISLQLGFGEIYKTCKKDGRK